MNRLSLRLRLTLVFAAAMALVLASVGAFLYVRLGDELDHQLERRLAASAATLQAVAAEGDGTFPEGALAEQEVAQVFDARDVVVAATASLAPAPVLDGEDLERARRGRVLLERHVLDDDPVLLLAEPLGGEGDVVVVGSSLESRDDAVNGLLTQLAIVIPLALLAASLAGYALAGAALRPVEAMRERAETISAHESGARLPLPRADDEVRRLGVTLNDMLGRLETAIERERRFVADASHELRTPLSTLRTELDLALRRPRTAEELEIALCSAAEETERLVRLADDLLVLARADAGALGLRRERVAATELLEAVAARFRGAASAAGRPLAVSDLDGVRLSADRARLEQALGNLVDNALAHGRGAVVLEARADERQVVLGVRDEGDGFPAQLRARAFERFTRGDEARTGASAGLGLAIVEAIAAAHGGSVAARDDPGGGAVVELALPA